MVPARIVTSRGSVFLENFVVCVKRIVLTGQVFNEQIARARRGSDSLLDDGNLPQMGDVSPQILQIFRGRLKYDNAAALPAQLREVHADIADVATCLEDRIARDDQILEELHAVPFST